LSELSDPPELPSSVAELVTLPADFMVSVLLILAVAFTGAGTLLQQGSVTQKKARSSVLLNKSLKDIMPNLRVKPDYNYLRIYCKTTNNETHIIVFIASYGTGLFCRLRAGSIIKKG
jgi:hypothetical protein